MCREEDDHFLPDGLVSEGVQLLSDVVSERLDQLGVCGPSVDHTPLHFRLQIAKARNKRS